MENVYVQNTWIEELNGLELGIMASLNYIKGNNDKFYFSQTILQDILFDDVVNNQRKVKLINDTIQNLINNKFIKILTTYGSGKNTTYVCDTNSVSIQENQTYTYLTLDTFKITSKLNIDMLKYLFAIGATFNNKTRVGYSSIDNICKNYDLNKSTFIRYEKIFEKNKILYIYHHKATTNKNGKIKTPNNNYGEYNNKENVITVANEYLEKIKNQKEDIINQTFEGGRSVKQRYNAFVRGVKYNDKQIKLLIEDCLIYNEFYNNRYKLFHYTSDLNKQLDMNVFK